MPRRAPLLPLLALLFPITLDAQFPIAAPEKRPAFGMQRGPVVAASGHDFLAAWEDGRADYGVPAELDIYGTRIGLDGAGVSGGGVPISPTGAYERSPAVLWNGSEYVVIHDVNGTAVFTRVLTDRIAERKEVSGSLLGGSRLEVAWSGNRYLIVKGDSWNVGGASLKASLTSADFNLVVPEFELSRGFLPSTASDGSNFLVVWLLDQGNYSTEIRFAVLSGNGTVRSAGTLAIFRRNETLLLTAPAVVWNGSKYLVVWSDAASISARHVDSQGKAAETFTIARSQGVEVTAPDVAWNGSMYLVSFSYRNEWPTPTTPPTMNLYAARVSADGTLIDSPYPLAITTRPGGNEPGSVAASGSTFIVVWEEEWDVLSATVDAATGVVSAPRFLARSVWRQSSARGVFDGTNLGFLWQESIGHPSAEPIVLFGRATPDGGHLDGGGIQLGQGWAGKIAVADVYLVTWWRNGESARAVRITRDGEILDSEPLFFSTSIGVLATDGRNFLHVGQVRVRSEHGPYDVSAPRLQIVGTAGAPTAPVEILPPAQFDEIPVGLAWNGSHYLLIYQHLLGRVDCYRCFPPRELRMVMLDRSGQRVSEPRVVGRDVTGFVAGGSDRFLIALGSAMESENRYIVIGDDGIEAGAGRLGFEPLDVAWDGSFFNISGFRYQSHVLRLDSTGAPVSESAVWGIAEPRARRLIGARGAVVVLDPYVEKPTSAHDAGILRYQFSWLEQRRRAVAR